MIDSSQLIVNHLYRMVCSKARLVLFSFNVEPTHHWLLILMISCQRTGKCSFRPCLPREPPKRKTAPGWFLCPMLLLSLLCKPDLTSSKGRLVIFCLTNFNQHGKPRKMRDYVIICGVIDTGGPQMLIASTEAVWWRPEGLSISIHDVESL